MSSVDLKCIVTFGELKKRIEKLFGRARASVQFR